MDIKLKSLIESGIELVDVNVDRRLRTNLHILAMEIIHSFKNIKFWNLNSNQLLLIQSSTPPVDFHYLFQQMCSYMLFIKLELTCRLN